MNIQENFKTTQNKLNILERARVLYESYKRCNSEKEFCLENGDTPETKAMYSFIGLNESMANSEKQFIFENGIGIPDLSLKSNSKYTLSGIAKSTKSVDEFIKTVNSDICEKFLLFSMSENDEKKLREIYINSER